MMPRLLHTADIESLKKITGPTEVLFVGFCFPVEGTTLEQVNDVLL